MKTSHSPVISLFFGLIFKEYELIWLSFPKKNYQNIFYILNGHLIHLNLSQLTAALAPSPSASAFSVLPQPCAEAASSSSGRTPSSEWWAVVQK